MTTNSLVNVEYEQVQVPLKQVVVTRPEVNDQVVIKQLKDKNGVKRVGILFKDSFAQRKLHENTARALYEALGVVLNNLK